MINVSWKKLRMLLRPIRKSVVLGIPVGKVCTPDPRKAYPLPQGSFFLIFLHLSSCSPPMGLTQKKTVHLGQCQAGFELWISNWPSLRYWSNFPISLSPSFPSSGWKLYIYPEDGRTNVVVFAQHLPMVSTDASYPGYSGQFRPTFFSNAEQFIYFYNFNINEGRNG